MEERSGHRCLELLLTVFVTRIYGQPCEMIATGNVGASGLAGIVEFTGYRGMMLGNDVDEATFLFSKFAIIDIPRYAGILSSLLVVFTFACFFLFLFFRIESILCIPRGEKNVEYNKWDDYYNLDNDHGQ